MICLPYFERIHNDQFSKRQALAIDLDEILNQYLEILRLSPTIGVLATITNRACSCTLVS